MGDLSQDPLDALDLLLTTPPPPAGPVAAVNDLTAEQRARVLSGKEGDQKGAAEALAALTAAVEAFQKGTVPSVVAEAAAASAAGIHVDVATLISMGALPPAPPEPADLDAPAPETLAAQAAAAQDAPPKEREIVNPLELPEDSDLVPVYNPQPGGVDLSYNGRTYPVRAGGVDLCHIDAVRLGVGPDNQGGTLSRFGVRRLFGPEPRFEEAAKAAGVSILEYVRRRNIAIVMLADGIAKRSSSEVADMLREFESRELEIPEEAPATE